MTSSSRREFVASLLGVPAALAACRPSAPALPPGELLLPGKMAGHRLRDDGDGAGGGDERPASFERARVVIVGGGASGLCSAWWLDRHGERDVVVLELDDVVGGTSQSGKSSLTGYPWGAHYIVAPMLHQQDLVALLGELGALEPGTPQAAAREAAMAEPAVAEQILCREPEERIYYRGRWYDGLYLHHGASPADLAELERFRALLAHWVAFRDARGRRAFALPAQLASDDAEVLELDRESFGAWLDRQGLRSPRLRWLADYACRDDYGLLAADTSAWAGLSYFASRMRAPGDEPQPVVTWPEGNGRLIAHLAHGLGPRLRLGHAVRHVRNTESGVEIVARGPAGLVGFHAERVIMAAPGFINRRIVAGLAADRAAPASDRGAWAVANLELETRPKTRATDAPLSWDNVLYDSPSLGYVVATHQSGRDWGPSVLTWYYPFTGDGAAARRNLDGATREDWAELALADLERAHREIRSICRRIHVAFWGHGMARPRVGSVFDPALRAARAPFGRVHFAGSELSGVSLFEEALDHGVRAAREAHAGLGPS